MLNFDYSLEPGRKALDKYKTDSIKPLVSVITPYYNGGKYFEQTYNSMVNQTFPYFEWIIVNDGSTIQEDVDLLNNFVQKDKRIKVFHTENKGATAARVYGIDNSTTDIIISFDADDLFDPIFIEVLYWALITNKDASWAYADQLGFGTQEYLYTKEFSSEIMKTENVACHMSTIRKKDYYEVGGYTVSENRDLFEDWMVWLKMLAAGKYPVHVKQHLFWYRRLDAWLSSIMNNNEKKDEAYKVIKHLADKVPDGIRSVTFDRHEAGTFKKPSKWDCDLVFPQKLEKTGILVLVPEMVLGGAGSFNLDLITNIDKKKYEIGIITTINSTNIMRQKFKEHSDDIFELPTFLRIDDWISFIHYYIQSRKVDICNYRRLADNRI